MSDHVKIIFEKMCSYVNVKLANVDFSNPDWQRAHSWTKEQEHDFLLWLTQYILEVSTSIDLEQGRTAATVFIMNFGWMNDDNLSA